MNLLKIEWLKIKSYRTFWILISIFAGLYIMVNYVMNHIITSVNDTPVKMIQESYAFPYVWNTMAYNYSWVVLFLSMFIIISVANDYTYKTQRQHIIDGMRRIEFLNGKIFLIVCISLCATTFYTLLAMLYGMMTGFDGMFEQIHLILYVFVYTLNYLFFAALLTLFIKRTGLTIIVFFAYLMFEAGISSYVNMKFNTYVGNFLPLQTSDELLPSRSLSKIKSLASQMTSGSDAPTYVYLIVSLVFIAIYYVVAKRKMETSDL